MILGNKNKQEPTTEPKGEPSSSTGRYFTKVLRLKFYGLDFDKKWKIK